MDLLISLLIALLNTLLNHTMLTRKKSVHYCVAAFTLISVIVYGALFIIKQFVTDIDLFKYIFCWMMFLYIVYIHNVFKETLSKKIFVMFSTWVISAIIYHISILLVALWIHTERPLDGINAIRIILQVVLLLFLAKPKFRENYRRLLSMVQDKVINLMSIYMIIAFLLLLNNMNNVAIELRNFASLYDLLLFYIFIILGYIIVFTGISSSSKMVGLQQSVEMAEKKSELHFKMANIDALTGIASRFSILNKITEAISDFSRCPEKFAVLMLDVDKFKLINDTYGHNTGDEVLKFLSAKIGGCLRDSDVIGRVGGDEFIILMKHIRSEEDVEAMIHRIFEAFMTPFVYNDIEILIHISIGICIFPDDAQNLDSLINQADQAMYHAKKTVGSSYSFQR